VHAEEERARGVNLDGGRAMEAHTEEKRGTSVEAVGAASRRMQRRSGCQRVCGGE
jgi:hypothetical protein